MYIYMIFKTNLQTWKHVSPLEGDRCKEVHCILIPHPERTTTLGHFFYRIMTGGRLPGGSKYFLKAGAKSAYLLTQLIHMRSITRTCLYRILFIFGIQLYRLADGYLCRVPVYNQYWLVFASSWLFLFFNQRQRALCHKECDLANRGSNSRPLHR